MASPAAVLSILVRANTGSATTGILRVNQSLGATEKAAGRAEHSTNKAFSSMARGADKAVVAFGMVAKVLTVGGTAAVAGGLAYSVKKAAEFEQQLSSLGSVADANAKQMTRFRKQALKAGADTKFSALEAAKAQTELAKGGLSVAQIMKGGLKAALGLAAAGEMELADAATATVNAMKLFGLRGKDSMKVADAFATAANRTTADVKDFAMALSQGGSAAKAAGLSFNETVAFLEALAEAGIKNSDAGTSMKTALLQIASPTEKAANLMKDLGLKFFDSAGNMKSLVEISDMLRKKMGGLTREQRVQATSTLAGTDGMRGLLALYDAGPKKIAGFEKGLAKQGTAAEVARKKQDNLKGSLEQLGGSVETLGIQIGSMLLPYIRTAADELTTFANRVGRIFARDDLSLGEKLQKSLDLAKVTAKPWIAKLKAAIDQANIPEKLATIVSTATPLILQAMAQSALTAAKTFATTFTNSSVWGKLALGTFLIRKLGLGGLLTGGFGKGGGGGALGGAASMTKPVPVWVVNGGAGGGGPAGVGGPAGGGKPGPMGKVKGLLKGAGKLGAGLAALDLAINLVDARGNPIQAGVNTAHDLTFGIVPKVHMDPVTAQDRKDKTVSDLAADLDRVTKKRDLGGLQSVIDKAKLLADDARAFNDQKLGKRLDELASTGSAALGKIGGQNRKVAGMTDRFADAIRGLRLKGSKDFDGLVSSVTSGSKQILRVGGEKSTETRKAVAKQFGIARDRVREAMHDKIISVKEGMERLHQLAVKELKLYGISAGRVNVVLAGSKSGNAGEMRPHARGGHITGGKPVGDSIPSLLERGEYVVNRKAVQKVGKDKLDKLNFGAAPRFQKGGMVDPAWDPGSERLASSISGKVGAWARRYQANMTAGYDPGGRHTSPGHNVTGTATDMVPLAGDWDLLEKGLRVLTGAGLKVLYGSNGVGTPWPNHGRGNHAHIEWGASGGAGLPGMFKGLARVGLLGPASVALEAGQGALDRVRGAANKAISQAIGFSGEGRERGSGATRTKGNGAALMKAISKARGWNFADWWALDASETSHGVNLSNPNSSARLRGQFLDFNWGKYGPGSDPRQNPSVAQQIRSMAAYIGERYGNPSKAWAFHQGHGYYRMGGKVPGVGSGDRVPAMLEPGEFVMRKQIVDRFGPTFFAGLNGMKKGGHVKGHKHPISDAHKRARERYEDAHAGAQNRQDAALRAARAARSRRRSSNPRAWDQNLQAYIGMFDSQLAVAQLTEGTADDLGILGTLRSFYQEGLKQAKRRGDTGKITEYARGLGGIQDQIKDLSTVPESGEDPNQPLIDALAAQTAAETEHTEALKAVKDEMKRQTDIAVQYASTSEFQKTKFLADIFSGQMGRGIIGRSFTPGTGVEHSY